jgi:hypothetical protein
MRPEEHGSVVATTNIRGACARETFQSSRGMPSECLGSTRHKDP